MPIYEYECAACGHRFERIRKFSDPPLDECPNCGERQVQKLLSSPAIQFKGTGWYITDYARKGGTGTDAKAPASNESSKDKGTKESKESRESKESKASTESKESKSPSESKTTPATSSSTSASKASGE